MCVCVCVCTTNKRSVIRQAAIVVVVADVVIVDVVIIPVVAAAVICVACSNICAGPRSFPPKPSAKSYINTANEVDIQKRKLLFIRANR